MNAPGERQLHLSNQMLALMSDVSGMFFLSYRRLRTLYLSNIIYINQIFRLGGPDPLDYISMYSHPGIAELNIAPHWHYIR